MSKHTPGPWGFDLEDNWVYSFRENGTQMLVAQARSISVTTEVRDANARLIAAAPDLLTALQAATEALDILRRGYGCEVSGLCYPALNDCRAAIAKATGGSS